MPTLSRAAPDLQREEKSQLVNASPSKSPGWYDSAPASAAEAAWPWYRPSRGPADRALWVHVIRLAACAASGLEADKWFPVSPQVGRARREAAAAIAVCQACPVRDQCLELSLRHWDIGQHGVWGGLVAAERAALRRQMGSGYGLPRAESGPDDAAGLAGDRSVSAVAPVIRIPLRPSRSRPDRARNWKG